MYTPLALPHAGMQSVYRIHYNTNDNMDSPAYTTLDVELERTRVGHVAYVAWNGRHESLRVLPGGCQL
jgi:hypothetical protein